MENEEVIVGDAYEIGDVIDISDSLMYSLTEKDLTAVGIRIYGTEYGTGEAYDAVPYAAWMYFMSSEDTSHERMYGFDIPEVLYSGHVDRFGGSFASRNFAEWLDWAGIDTTWLVEAVFSRHSITKFSFLYPIS